MAPRPVSVVVGLDAVIVAVTDEVPRVLTVGASGRRGRAHDTLPHGPLRTDDRTLERAVRRWVAEQTSIEIDYVEQLYTFGDTDRDPGRGRARVISVAYLALVREGDATLGRWRDFYDFFPWEDWRGGRPRFIDRAVRPALRRWERAADDAGGRKQRRERVALAFAADGGAWDGDAVLERYELLYEAGLVPEGKGREPALPPTVAGRPMALDHRRMLATALARVRGKIKYRPVVFELLPDDFTLLELQRVVEALAGVRLHKQNFRRLVDRGGLVEGTGRQVRGHAGRPAELFRFRREVLRERVAPGVRVPAGRPRTT